MFAANTAFSGSEPVRRFSRPAFALAASLVLTSVAVAADPPDPLKFIPASAKLVVKVEKPRQLAEAVTGLQAVKDAQGLAPVRGVLDSATIRRFFQMLTYVEKELGAKWPDLLDQLAGGGIALGTTFGDNAPAVLVIQGTDEQQTAKAFDLLYRILDDELARQGFKGGLVKGTNRGAETFRLGDSFYYARVRSTVLISNKEEALGEAILTATTDKGVTTKKTLHEARKLLPKDPLAWLWIDFAAVKQTQETKDFFDATRKDFLQTLVAGSTIDCVRRSDFVALGLYQEAKGFRLALRLPAGRDAFPEEFAFHVPPKGQPGSLPLLEPPGVLASLSFHLDIGYYWKHREQFIPEEMRKQLEEGEKQLSKFLPGSVKFGELLEMWGPYHRLVAVNHDVPPYKTVPGQRFPAFGYVATMRDPKFGQQVESTVRSAALITTFQFGLKMSETEHDGVKIVAYRFPEGKEMAEDPDNVRFNFEPCFAHVEGQFIAATTVELCKKLIVEVKRTAKVPPSPAVWRGKGYAVGAANALAALPEPLVTDAILTGGVGIEDARKQVDALTAWLKTLGTVRLEIDERETEYRLDVVWEYK
jgi:hypothetical protein